MDDVVSAPANRLKFYRTKRKLSQRELASAAGLTQPTIQRIEAHVNAPEPRSAESIAKALDTPLAEVFPNLTTPAEYDPEAPRLRLLRFALLDVGVTHDFMIDADNLDQVIASLSGHTTFVIFETGSARVYVARDRISRVYFQHQEVEEIDDTDEMKERLLDLRSQDPGADVYCLYRGDESEDHLLSVPAHADDDDPNYLKAFDEMRHIDAILRLLRGASDHQMLTFTDDGADKVTLNTANLDILGIRLTWFYPELAEAELDGEEEDDEVMSGLDKEVLGALVRTPPGIARSILSGSALQVAGLYPLMARTSARRYQEQADAKFDDAQLDADIAQMKRLIAEHTVSVNERIAQRPPGLPEVAPVVINRFADLEGAIHNIMTIDQLAANRGVADEIAEDPQALLDFLRALDAKAMRRAMNDVLSRAFDVRLSGRDYYVRQRLLSVAAELCQESLLRVEGLGQHLVGAALKRIQAIVAKTPGVPDDRPDIEAASTLIAARMDAEFDFDPHVHKLEQQTLVEAVIDGLVLEHFKIDDMDEIDQRAAEKFAKTLRRLPIPQEVMRVIGMAMGVEDQDETPITLH